MANSGCHRAATRELIGDERETGYIWGPRMNPATTLSRFAPLALVGFSLIFACSHKTVPHAPPPASANTCTENAPSDLQSEVAERSKEAVACYTAALRRNQRQTGQIAVRVRVNEDGTVDHVTITGDEMGDTELASCMRGVFLPGYDAHPSGCVDVVLPVASNVNGPDEPPHPPLSGAVPSVPTGGTARPGH